jgi:alpha-tubulin suppressor-like RCC1 family protein
MKSTSGHGRMSLTDKRSRCLTVTGLLVVAPVLGAAASSAQADIEYTFGLNEYGAIGNGTTGAGTASNSPTSPVMVSTLDSGVTAAAQGAAHSLAVDKGALYGWGLNAYGMTGDGTATGAGTSETTPQATPLITGVTAVSAGLYDSMAIANGGVYTFGLGTYGSLGNGSTSSQNTTPTLVASLSSGVTAISAGIQTNYAIQRGSLYAFGYGYYGLLGNGNYGTGSAPAIATTPIQVDTLTSGVTAVAAGGYHTLAVMNGAAYAFGFNAYGELGNPTLNSGYATTSFYAEPMAIPTLTTGVTQVAAGQYHSLVLANGVIYAFGQNTYGQLGNGTLTDSAVPVPVTLPDLSPVKTLVAGFSSSYALLADGTLWDWGQNNYGQLGLGSATGYFALPQEVTAPAGYTITGVFVGSDAETVSILETATAPEPTSLALLGLATALPLARRRRRHA